MKKFAFNNILVLLVFLFPTSIIYPQDSSKIVILSEKVGSVIDADERDYFGLFEKFDSFNDAVIYKAPDSLFYCKVSFDIDGSLKDTTYLIQYGQLINMAVRITYFEDLKLGKTDIDSHNIKLSFVSGEDIKNINTELYNRVGQKIVLKTLPLSAIKIEHGNLIKQNWQFGISTGIEYNSIDFQGLGEIFNFIEDNIPAEGYDVPNSNLTFSANPLFSFTAFFLYRNMLKGEIEYSFSNMTDKRLGLSYKTFSISINYLLPRLNFIEPYVSAGYIGVSFTAKNGYNLRVSQNGTLESITIDGNSKGFKFGGGIFLNPDDNISFNIFGNYNLLPNITEIKNNPGYDISGYKTEVKMDGFVIGLSLIWK